MKCNNCGNEVEATKFGHRCPICGKSLENNNELETTENEVTSQSTSEGTKGMLIAIISVLILLAGVGIGIYFLTQNNTFAGLLYILSGIIGFAFAKGFADIIDLLEQINNKLK